MSDRIHHIPTQPQLDAARQSGLQSTSIDPSMIGLGSPQLMFAIMQMECSQQAKDQAMAYMDEIKNTQAEQKKVAEFLQQARQLQADAKSGGDPACKNCTLMPAEMRAYMSANGLAWDKTGNDNWHNKDEWEVAIKSLEARSETLGAETQQKMVLIQDFLGQYNAYTQGANSAVKDNAQTLKSLAEVR